LCGPSWTSKAVTGDLGGKVGIAPRVFLKKLVGDVLDRVDQFPEFDPRRDYQLTIVDSELSEVERNAGQRRALTTSTSTSAPRHRGAR
jgi:hypothetical protein